MSQLFSGLEDDFKLILSLLLKVYSTNTTLFCIKVNIATELSRRKWEQNLSAIYENVGGSCKQNCQTYDTEANHD